MRVNSVDPDEAAHYELSHLHLGCLEINKFLLLYIIISVDRSERFILSANSSCFNSLTLLHGLCEYNTVKHYKQK